MTTKTQLITLIRQRCTKCCSTAYEVTLCPSTKCKLHEYRHGPRSDETPMPKAKGTLLIIIRKHCLDCLETADEVKKCTVKDCEFYPYRSGRDPYKKSSRILRGESVSRFVQSA
jgi:hypothetical protein